MGTADSWGGSWGALGGRPTSRPTSQGVVDRPPGGSPYLHYGFGFLQGRALIYTLCPFVVGAPSSCRSPSVVGQGTSLLLSSLLGPLLPYTIHLLLPHGSPGWLVSCCWIGVLSHEARLVGEIHREVPASLHLSLAPCR